MASKTAMVEISTKNPKFGLVTAKLPVPQVSDLEEAAQFYGGADNLLTVVNRTIATDSGNGGRAVLRSEKFDTLEACLEKAAEVTRDYNPRVAQGPSQRTVEKKKAQNFDAVAQLALENLSPEEFQRRMLELIQNQAAA